MSKESNLKAWEDCPKWICRDCGNTTFLLRKLEHPLDGIFPDVYCSRCGSMVLIEAREKMKVGDEYKWVDKKEKAKKNVERK